MRVRATFATLIIVLCCATSHAQDSDPVAAGYMRLYAGQPEEAHAHFGQLRADNSQALAPWFGLLFAQMARIDQDEETLAPEFERGIDALIAHASQRHARSAADAEALFYLAQSYLLRSTYRLNYDKGMWGAARDAAKSKGFADEYVKRHPEHGDAYLVLGLYNYYVDIAPNLVKVLRVLLLLPSGSRTEGLKQLERASRDGQLFAPFAHAALAGIYGSYEGRVSDAITLAEHYVRRFPRSADMRLELASFYLHPSVEDYTRAGEHYAAVSAAATQATPRHWSEKYQAVLGMANLRRTQWRLEEAIALVTTAIDQNPAKPVWVMPNLLLRRANYKMLLNDPTGADDARRVLSAPTMKTWHKGASRQIAAIEARGRTDEGRIYASLIPGNRLVADDRFDEAMAVYDRIGALHPGDFQVRYRRAYLEFARQRYDVAGAALEPIVATATKLPDWLRAGAMLALAWTHDLAGRRDEAMKLYKRIVDTYEDEAAAGAARLGLTAPYRNRSK